MLRRRSLVRIHLHRLLPLTPPQAEEEESASDQLHVSVQNPLVHSPTPIFSSSVGVHMMPRCPHNPSGQSPVITRRVASWRSCGGSTGQRETRSESSWSCSGSGDNDCLLSESTRVRLCPVGSARPPVPAVLLRCAGQTCADSAEKLRHGVRRIRNDAHTVPQTPRSS
ncbi:unnamed protein product [Pleuronectes platessa]|uniref:Uncharacterized protein n=1 Tax=Pleuronectes platessa TaxID=8262 RepID=A0A9N7UL75_PLEPL|nr:unnamed protein product [Pleuronectes platessa]